MKAFQLYLFDFDGTLFDTLGSSIYVFKESFKKLGIDIKDEDVLLYTRRPVPDTYEELNAPKEKWDEYIKSIDDLLDVKQSLDKIKIYNDTFDTILDLKILEADLGIVTSNNLIHVNNVLNKFDLQKGYFNVLIGNREAPIPKPDPSPILIALKTANYKGDKTDVCYVGDALNDCIAAEKAGVTPILLDRNNEYQDSKYIRISSLKELLE